jgi:hypothetical protein
MPSKKPWSSHQVDLCLSPSSCCFDWWVVSFKRRLSYLYNKLYMKTGGHGAGFYMVMLTKRLEEELKRIKILWRIDQLLRGDSASNSRFYGTPAVEACVVTSHNRRGDAGGVFCRSAPRLWLYRPSSVERVRAVQLRVHLWSVKQRATEVEYFPLLRFVTRKRPVKTLQSIAIVESCY